VSMKELPEKYRCESFPVDESLSPPGGNEPASVAPAPPEMAWNDEGLDFNGLISEFEDRLIMQALSRTGGNKKEAARLLNLKRTTLIEKIKKKNLPV